MQILDSKKIPRPTDYEFTVRFTAGELQSLARSRAYYVQNLPGIFIKLADSIIEASLRLEDAPSDRDVRNSE